MSILNELTKVVWQTKTTPTSTPALESEIVRSGDMTAITDLINNIVNYFQLYATPVSAASTITLTSQFNKIVGNVTISNINTSLLDSGIYFLWFTDSLTIQHAAGGVGEILLSRGANFIVGNDIILGFAVRDDGKVQELGTTSLVTAASHEQNTDNYLAYGTSNEVSAVQLRALVDAGLLTLSENNFFVGNSSNQTVKKTLSETKVILGIGEAGYFSCGVADATVPTFTDNNNGSLTIAGCDVALRTNANHLGNINVYSVSGATLSFIDGEEEYVAIKYNAGTPIYYVESDITEINGSDVILVYIIWRQGNILHSADQDCLANGLSNKINNRLVLADYYKITNEGGLVISESTSPTNRTILLTSAHVYKGVVLDNVLAFASNTDLLTESVNTAGGWTYSNVNVYDNTNINTSNAGKTAMNNNKFAFRHYYRSIGDSKQIFYVLSDNEYNNESECRVASELQRTDLPILIRDHCLLVGRSIIQKSATNGITEKYIQRTGFFTSSVQNHNDLSNIQGGTSGEYYHLTSALASRVADLEITDSPEFANVQITSLASDSWWANTAKSVLNWIDTFAAYFKNLLSVKKTNGFRYSGALNTDSVLSFVDGTRTFSITPNSSYDIYLSGKKITKTIVNSIVISNTLGTHFIYFDANGTIQESTSPWDILASAAPICTLNWNGTYGRIGDERHGAARDVTWHNYTHKTIGTRYESGLTLTANSNNTFSLTSGVVHDEDIIINITAQTNCLIWYRAVGGATMTHSGTKGTAWYLKNGTNIQYDNAGTLTDAGSNAYVAYWFYATNDIDSPIYVFVGQRTDTTLANAEANNNAADLLIPVLPSVEMKLLYRVIVRNNNPTFTVSIANGDFRTVQSVTGSTSSVNDHAALINRNIANQHTLAAISGDVAGAIPFVKSDLTGHEDSSTLTYDNTNNVLTTGGATFNAKRVQFKQGADVTSANNLAVGLDGNSFTITGTTQVNLLSGASWQQGSVIQLWFNGITTIKHNQTASGDYKPIILSCGTDFTTSVGKSLQLEYRSDSKWYEIGESTTVNNIVNLGVWTNIYSSANSTPASTSTITMTANLTATVKKGMGVRFKIGAESTYRYGIITAITSNLLTIAKSTGGLTTGAGDLKDLWFCPAYNLATFFYDLNAKSLNATNSATDISNVLTNLATHGNFFPNLYKGQKARIVLAEIQALSKGSGSNPAVNFKTVDSSNNVSGNIATSNITISGNATWYDTGITIDPANNAIDYDSRLTMQVATAATAATETSFQITIIYE